MTQSALTMGVKMKKVNLPRESHTYIVFHRRTNRSYGESSAVSPEKAINNVWWNNIKHRDPYTLTDIRPEDLNAVELNN